MLAGEFVEDGLSAEGVVGRMPVAGARVFEGEERVVEGFRGVDGDY